MPEDLIARRRELLRRKLVESGLASDVTAPVRTRSAGERSPLSVGQQRLWFLQTRDPDDTTLNVCVAYRLSGRLDVDRLRAALSDVVGRHEILRTSYGVGDDGIPYQSAAEHVEVPWSEHDLTDLAEQSRSRRLEVLARREFGRPFDLARDVLVRATLVRTGRDEWVFIFVVHHICWDDDSWAVFFDDLNAAYDGRSAHRPPTQFLDVATDPAALAVDDPAIAYWRELLSPAPEWLELPAETPGVASKNAGRGSRSMPSDVMEAVNELARAASTTPFTVLLAAFGTLIHRYTGATDFLVAVPITDRRKSGADRAIGYFGNTVLVRTTIDPRAPFADLIAATRDNALGAFGHQHVGIDRVVRELNPDRSGGDGLEQIVRLSFSTRKSAVGFALDGVTAEQLDLAASVTQMPVGLTVVRDGDDASVEAEYFADVLDHAIVDDMLAAYVRLLHQAVASPSTQIVDLDILGEGRAEIIERSHGDQVSATPATLPEMFESRVRAHPDQPAIIDDSHTLTYAELNARSNRLARWFISRDIGPEDLVALSLAASVEFVVAAVAVLKAGAAYLPIDPSYPQDRIDFLVEDARPRIVLSQADLAAAEQAAEALPVVDPVDADRIRPLLPAGLAYVIYTSGSTGRPKGVPVPHAAIADHLAGFHAQFGMTAEDRLVQTSSVSFDASLFEVFCTLTLGATLVIPKSDGLQDIPYMADLLVRQGVTVMHMVPSMLGMFLLLPGVNEWTTLRQIPVGGEALPGEIADKFGTVFDAQLRNNYGPTEAVVAATHYPVDGPQGVRIVPIGVPNRNVTVYILDAALQLVPTGVVGEIYIGGEQLARGYLGRPALTAERFVADPMSPGGRLYRTGDLARWNVDGDIEFVGRIDEQVKIRGFRIELGEVESALAGHPAVARALVIVTDDPRVGASLAAYLVAERDQTIEIGAVRDHAASVLPEYMVPSGFAVIDEIPLTAHGKLDRRALPEPVSSRPAESRAPTTPTEIRVAALFASLFGRDDIGADDSFFELGGHSLLAARLVTQIRTEFGVDIDVRAPFDTPTVAGLATWLVAQVRSEFGIDLDAHDDDEGGDWDLSSSSIAEAAASSSLTGAPRRPAISARTEAPEHVPLSYSQLAMWFARSFEGPSAVGNIPMAVRIDGPLDVPALTDALGDVIARHSALRTTFVEREGVPYQVVGPVEPAVLPLTVVNGTSIAEKEARLSAELDRVAGHTFAIESERLIRTELFSLGDNSHVLSILVHHMVIDHWSFNLLLADVATAYRHRLGHRSAPPWLPLPIQYSDYALWQRDLFEPGAVAHDVGDAQLEYWRSTLAGIPDHITVAADRPRPAVLGKTGEIVTFAVPADLRAKLRAVADRVGVSEFMLLNSAVATLLHKLGGGDDITIGTPVAGRTDDATADIVGLFANMAVLRNDFSGSLTLHDVLIRGRDAALGAYANQDVPIERLVEALNPRRTRSRNPLFQVMMHFRDEHGRDEHSRDEHGREESGASSASALTDGTTISLLPVDFETSFLDLNIIFASQADGGLAARLVASTDLYDRDTAEEMARRMIVMLGHFADHVDTPVEKADVLLADERHRLLDQWCDGGPLDVEAFRARMNALPAGSDTIAIRRGDDVLDYRSLADDLARNDNAGGPLSDVVTVVRDALRGQPCQLPVPSTDTIRLIAVRSGDPVMVSELLAGLSDGATVVLATDSERTDPAALAAVIAGQSAQRVVASPDMLGMLPHSGVSMMPSVRTWVAASVSTQPSLGETLGSLSAGSVAEYRYTAGDPDAIVVTGELSGSHSGRPAPGSKVLVLDAHLDPVPPGVVGDVHVQVAGSGPVCTGDRARWDRTGSLVFQMHSEATVAGGVVGVAGGGEQPQTDTERAICDVLAELLDIDGVGRDDNFFALGGDSVISIQLAGKLAAENIPLTPQMIFDHHTIAEVAAAVDEARAAAPGSDEDPEAGRPEAPAATHAPMSVSGLSDDALAALTASWKPGS
ncbi:mycobactin peptide synthetase MbtE [Williamsia muralis]|uniref:Mycobactin peptide synthetase MbtE n=1 Tax=Williamsia marianensis TaxID=85044 RepID=A0A495K744_WILMA|nr:non-ribosomal peptide synthetase [Williamsia muralis]RKR97120.1 mycobactin peptide synthetase MbtE [Williamsia muralis]